MNDLCNGSPISNCSKAENKTDGSLDDEISLLETTLVDSINEETSFSNNSNCEINYSGSPKIKQTGLDVLFPDNFEVKDNNEVNLSMQLTYPANPSFLPSSKKHMELYDKQVMDENSVSYSISKSITDPFTVTNDCNLHDMSNHFNSIASVQNKDCDIIISQCDSSLEDKKLYIPDGSFSSCNFVIQCDHADTNIMTNTDNEVNMCKSSGINIENVESSSEIISDKVSFVPVLNSISKVSSQHVSANEELKTETSHISISVENNDLLDNDKIYDKKRNTYNNVSIVIEELKKDKHPKFKQKEEMILVNVISDNNSIITTNEKIDNEKAVTANCIEDQDKSSIYYSTPIAVKQCANLHPSQDLSSGFDQVSPMPSSNCKSKLNLKRKIELSVIEEIDENAEEIVEKKLKCDEYSELNKNLVLSKTGDNTIDPTLPCYETPAKSILKMWQPTCLSRNSSSQYYTIDEVNKAESDSDDNKKNDPDQPVDDFELACRSLTEELLKDSSNIETLEKYHSQVQLESQLDDDKFNEVFLELTQKFELGDNTCLSIRSMDQSASTDKDKTITNANNTTNATVSNSSINNSSIEGDNIVVEVDPTPTDEKADSGTTNATIKIIINDPSDASGSKNESTDGVDHPAQSCSKQIPTIVYASKEDAAMDEEDMLLEDEAEKGHKPYEFVEFISEDPRENEDNYNPEWQKLGKLTTDEERYKAVRDQWRSLVPPDPNKDLTCRQWRAKNNLPPLNIGSFNNNESKPSGSSKNQHCTAVFQLKINNIVQELEDRRMAIMFNTNRGFEELDMKQNNEHRMILMRGCSNHEITNLRCQHLMECRQLKDMHDRDLRMIEHEAAERINKLKTASEEVKRFQKFYLGLGGISENGQFLSDLDVQEQLETENMLDQYKKFYD